MSSQINLINNAVDISANTINAINSVTSVSSSLLKFTSFAPLISDVLKLVQEIVELYETAEHNKCFAAEAAIKSLSVRRKEDAEFFSKEQNYTLLCKFKSSIEKIKRFIQQILQLTGFRKFTIGVFQANTVKEELTSLITEFDGYVRSLNFSITVSIKLQQSEIDKDLKIMKKHPRGITNLSGEVSGVFEKISALNSLYHENNSFQVIDKVINGFILDINSFSNQLGSNRNHRIHRRRRKKDYADVSFEEVPAESLDDEVIKQDLQRQISILKMLEDSSHIIKFYGLVEYVNRRYLVTEWAEFGSLQSYYKTYGPLKWNKRLELALDITRGLSFLHNSGILHRDVRSENIFVNEHEQAKIANFGLSRGFNENTGRHSRDAEQLRYTAPEKLQDSKYKYDIKCEIYSHSSMLTKDDSFGILLWELAEERLPFESLKGVHIVAAVLEGKRCIKFSRSYPSAEYRRLVTNATIDEPKSRPSITDIFNTLIFISERHKNESPNFSSNKNVHSNANLEDECLINTINMPSMTIDEAIQQHKKHDDYSNDKRYQQAALYFKESAESGFVEAQLRYGYMVWHGYGLERNIEEAIKYYKLAADNGNLQAMFNIGQIYWVRNNSREEKQQGEEYLRKASYKGLQTSIEFCNKSGIQL
ncbi:28327_t:CDS:2 [Gigaspora margarita]|uniref:28327_t:CDS:1 n=1 Tax=Gigaspora margarita TaxID=4874 RepID=A0ABN7UJR7_GIGMA|nr:28327_t:CDS:2 [Gigaspora margarita]